MPETSDIIRETMNSLSESEPAPIDTTPDDSDLDSAPSADADPAPAPVAEPTAEPAAEKPAKEEKKPEDDDDFSKVPESVTDAWGRKRVNSIPHPRVKRMVETAAERAKTEVRTQLEAEYAPKIKSYEERLAEYDSSGAIMAHEPDRFMAMLVHYNPEYAKFVKGGAAPAAESAPAGADDPRPQPDGEYADGSKGYTPAGLEKLEAWQARQVERRVLGEVSKKYGWIDDAKKAQDARDAAVPGVRAQISAAMNEWEGFQDHFDEILGVLQSDTSKRLTLHDAYRKVVVGKHKAEREKWTADAEKLKTDRNKLREEILKEINGRPAATATVPTTSVAKPEDTAPKDPKDIIRATMRAMK